MPVVCEWINVASAERVGKGRGCWGHYIDWCRVSIDYNHYGASLNQQVFDARAAKSHQEALRALPVWGGTKKFAIYIGGPKQLPGYFGEKNENIKSIRNFKLGRTRCND